MSKLRFRITLSLDGYVAGPNQSVKEPLGEGGMELHKWAFALDTWRKMHGMTGGEANASSKVMEEQLANTGAVIMGRNMFGGHPGPWAKENPWVGWWGDNPPFHHPVFVLTHYHRGTLHCDGGTTFTFVTEGIESALDQAFQAANGKDVALAGGAHAAQQYLKAGLVDEMELSIVPVLLGSGERLFENVGPNPNGWKLVRAVEAPGVAHLKFLKS